MNNKDFFIKYGSKKICYRNDGSVWSDESFTPELLAQAIEDRIMERVLNLKADVQGVYSQADLVEKE